MKSILFTLVLLMPSIAHAEDRIFRISLATAVAAHGADLASTMHCLGAKTCHETNPALLRFTTQPAVMGGVKMGIAAVSLLATARLHESHPKLATVINFGMTAFFTGVAVSNSRQAR